MLGRLLWISVDRVVILHELMRQSGRTNAGFVDLLQCLHNGVCNDADYDVLANRCLGTLVSPDEKWGSLPLLL